MMRRVALMLLTGMVFGFCSLAAAEDDLKTVEKKVIDSWMKHKSMTGKFTMVSHTEMSGMVIDGKAEGTFEIMRKGDKYFARQEMTNVMTQKSGDQETKMEQQMLSIVDGEHAYMLNDMGGQKMATKSKIDPKMTGDPKATFEWLREDHELKLLPEETIEGEKAYAIEAKPKEKTPIGPTKYIYYFQQSNGFMVKMVAYGPDDKPQTTMTHTDIKLDVDINPDRFVFKAPPGVQVIDQTGTMP